MSTRWLRIFLSISLILAGNLPAFPAESTAGPKKIGLVLEGGGALGLAHIGVLQWLEEHRIPVSYVAGTSMGGLVGGMYAVGNSPEQIHQIVNGINWDEVMADKPRLPTSLIVARKTLRTIPTVLSSVSRMEFDSPKDSTPDTRLD